MLAVPNAVMAPWTVGRPDKIPSVMGNLPHVRASHGKIAARRPLRIEERDLATGNGDVLAQLVVTTISLNMSEGSV